MNSTLARAKEIIQAEAQVLLSIPLDDFFEEAVEILLSCKGKVITTWMGKAGNIAVKTAGTLCSTGTPGIDHIIGVTSHPDSAISQLSSVVINMGEIAKPCYLGLTPTTSTQVMMAIGDALSLILMEKEKITRQQYGLRHHDGYLGQMAKQTQIKITAHPAAAPKEQIT
ncbi:MAG: capsule biosynthesis protein [Chitinispirillaceae bacterium]